MQAASNCACVAVGILLHSRSMPLLQSYPSYSSYVISGACGLTAAVVEGMKMVPVGVAAVDVAITGVVAVQFVIVE